MISLQETMPAPVAAHGHGTPRIWGLDARQLHDAYWRAHGIVVVRRGEPMPRQRGVDLYMLIEPEQLVRFDVHALADRLAWRAAAVTRLRVIASAPRAYEEHVDVDEAGFVRRIERSYYARTRAAYRIMLTPRATFARLWTEAASRRAAWRAIRAAAGLSNVDYWKCPGDCCTAGCPEEERTLLARLVDAWREPDRALDGIEAVAPGVWAVKGTTGVDASRAIGPAWLGLERTPHEIGCIVGPEYWEDAPEASGAVRVRDVHTIEPAGDVVDAGIRPGAARRPVYRCAKRTLDVVLSATGLVVLAPLLALVALAVLIDDGRPILFGHRRQTMGGRSFLCWKFRSMRRDADEIKSRLEDANRCDGPQFFMEDDPRVTRVGRILRRFQLDELPQLWNVLVGQMSLVGPRPSPDDENRICPSWREIRLSVRPGITGLWQLRRTRQPGVDFQEWIRFDTEYVEQAGFLFDLRILVLTLWSLLPWGSDDETDETR